MFGADFYKAKLELASGQILDGYADFPGNNLLNRSVSYRPSAKAKSTSYKNDDLLKITYTHDGHEYIFERANIHEFIGKREKTTSFKQWLFAVYTTPVLTYYNCASSYYIDKEGIMVAKAPNSSGTWAEIPLLFKRPGEETPTKITSLNFGATVLGTEKRFKREAARYFEGETALITRIEKGEFKSGDMFELGKAYITLKETTVIK